MEHSCSTEDCSSTTPPDDETEDPSSAPPPDGKINQLEKVLSNILVLRGHIV